MSLSTEVVCVVALVTMCVGLLLGGIVACSNPSEPEVFCEQVFVIDTLVAAGDTAWVVAVERCRR